jgi:hypothetical protein
MNLYSVVLTLLFVTVLTGCEGRTSDEANSEREDALAEDDPNVPSVPPEWAQQYIGLEPSLPTNEGPISIASLYFEDGTSIPAVGAGVIQLGEESLVFMSHEWPEDHPHILDLSPVSDSIPIFLMEGPQTIGGFLLHSDFTVVQVAYTTDTNGQIAGSRVTRMNISPLRSTGDSLYFAGRRWVPLDDQESLIICTPQGIIGINVRVDE